MTKYQMAKQQYGALPQSAKGQEVVKATTHLNAAYGELFNELEYNLQRRDTTCMKSLRSVATAYVDMFRNAQGSIAKLEQFLEMTRDDNSSSNIGQCEVPRRSERHHAVAYHRDTTLPNRVFGVPLSNVLISNEMEHDVTNAFTLQYNIQYLFDTVRKQGMTMEGIFRIPGNENFMRDITHMLEMGYPVVVLPNKDHYVHSIAGVLKAWIRDLPEPLMSFDAFESLLPLANDLDKSQQRRFVFSPITNRLTEEEEEMPTTRRDKIVIASHVRHFIQSRLPREHQYVLAKLMCLLHDIAQNEHTTRMNAKNLGIVFGMNIFRPRVENPLLMAANVQKMSSLVELMCGEMYDHIFQNLQIIENLDAYAEIPLIEAYYESMADIPFSIESLHDGDEYDEDDFEYDHQGQQQFHLDNDSRSNIELR